jgi:hypothetical protein
VSDEEPEWDRHIRSIPKIIAINTTNMKMPRRIATASMPVIVARAA